MFLARIPVDRPQLLKTDQDVPDRLPRTQAERVRGLSGRVGRYCGSLTLVAVLVSVFVFNGARHHAAEAHAVSDGFLDFANYAGQPGIERIMAVKHAFYSTRPRAWTPGCCSFLERYM